ILYESDQLFTDLKKIEQYIPLSLFMEILEMRPDGKFEILKVKNKLVLQPNVKAGETIDVVYTRFRKHRVVPEDTKKADWRVYYGPVKDQGKHDICWAVVAAELVTAIRWIKGRENGTEYSYQELVDFVFPEKGKLNGKEDHFCYKLSIVKALRYIVQHGIQKAEDRPFDGCKEFPPPRVLLHPDLGYIGAVKSLTLEEALIRLQTQPIGAAMPIFRPDYDNIKGGIYSGPMHWDSRFCGMHAVSITGAGTDDETGESFMYVRSSHGVRLGKDGYFRVSIDVMLLRTGEGYQEHEANYFTNPTPLLVRFCVPELLEEDEEKKIKEKTAEKL
ncbi:unnamed protein product, partial [Arabidopsis halleri]